MGNCTYIDGIGSSQAIDTAGEIVDIRGLDCSMLLGAAFNYEHKSDVPAQVVGKILDFKKIFSEKDCETERHLHFWNKCQTPFLYISGRLFDDKKESSKELAALFIDDAEHPQEKAMMWYSVEGNQIKGAKEGMVLTRSIARKVTITTMPANKTCVAELLSSPGFKPKDDLESIFKKESTQVEFFEPDSKYLEFLEKKEEIMAKEENLSDLNKALPSGWKPSMTQHSQLGSIATLSHPQHGIVTIHKNPETGNHEVKHEGALAGVMGQKGVFSNPKDAMMHASKYVSAVSNGKVLPRTQVNLPSSDKLPNAANKKPTPMVKSLEAGSGMAAPGQLVQGAALVSEDLSGSKKKKSMWLKRAEDAYARWEKREEFRKFMGKSMPNLAKGEIDAIGQVIALKKSMEAEETLEKMFSSYFIKDDNL